MPTSDLELDLPPLRHRIRLPENRTGLDQDEEFFEVEIDGSKRRLRLHDYAELFAEPGLYEALVYRELECRSPLHVVPLLEQLVAREGEGASSLRVLDLGAGNGVVGDLLRQIGVADIVAVDLLPEAAKAAERDRPGVYSDYVVTDLTQDDEEARRRLEDFRPNCLAVVAALGYGDIPPEAFVRAFNFVEPGGWIALGIKDRFLEEDDDSGFGRLVRRLVAEGVLEERARTRYVHRQSVTGDALHYVALIARKRRDA